MRTFKHIRRMLVLCGLAMPLIMCLCLAPQGDAYGALQYVEEDLSAGILQVGGLIQPHKSENLDDSLRTQSTSNTDGFVAALEQEVAAWDGTTDRIEVVAEDYGLYTSELSGLISQFLNTHGQFFFLDGQYGWSAYSDGSVQSVYLLVDTSYTLKDVQDFNSRAQSVVSKVDPSWTQEQKALYLHDWLCTHCSYDLTYSHYNAHDALVVGTAVCQGYSEAYDYLLELVGIESDIVSSEAIDHAWNLVTIDGHPYYVDCTWDDPSNLHVASYAAHNNFLRSRSGIYGTEHESTDWLDSSGANIYSKGVAVDSTHYDDYYWKQCNTLIPHVGTLWAYTTDDGAVRVHDYATGADRVLVTNVGQWPVVGRTSTWQGNHASLASAGSRFLVAKATEVLLVDPDGSSSSVYSLPASEQAKGYLYSLLYNDETESYDVTWNVSLTEAIVGSTSLTLETGDDIAAVVEPQACKLVYDGSPHELVIPGSTTIGSMRYALSEDGPYAESVPTATTAGTYTVWWRIERDPNNHDAPQSVSITIGKAAWSMTAKTAKLTTTYKTEAQTLNNPLTVQSNANSLSYAVAGLTYVSANPQSGTLTIAKGCPVGTYKLKVTVSAPSDENHTAVSKTWDVELAVAKAKNNLTVKSVKKTFAAYAAKKTTLKAKSAFKVSKNTSKGKLSYTKKSGNRLITVSKTGVLTIKRGLKKGSTYSVTVKVKSAATKNYLAASKTVTFKVKVN